MLKAIIVLTLAGLISPSALAQSNPDPAVTNTVKRFYQLDFLAQELESGRVINSRSYSMILNSDTKRSSIRAGEKVPFASSSGTTTQYQQIDVGVNIDCRELQELGDRVALMVHAEISSVIENRGETSSPQSLPIIRNNSWESTVLVPLKQPTVIFSSDDPASKRTMQLKLTVVPVH